MEVNALVQSTTSITHYKNWRISHNGNSIDLFESEACQKGKRPTLLWMGGVHGDEPESVHLCHHLLDQLKSNDKINQSVPWLMVPCLNPDGILSGQRTNGRKVDINRNYPSTDWSPEHSKPRYFPGIEAGSEIETQAVLDLIRNYNPFLIVHCHAYKPSLTYTGEPAKRFVEWLNFGVDYALQTDIGYPTPGSLGQYAWIDLSIPVICIEIEEGSSKEKVISTFDQGLMNFFNRLAHEL